MPRFHFPAEAERPTTASTTKTAAATGGGSNKVRVNAGDAISALSTVTNGVNNSSSSSSKRTTKVASFASHPGGGFTATPSSKSGTFAGLGSKTPDAWYDLSVGNGGGDEEEREDEANGHRGGSTACPPPSGGISNNNGEARDCYYTSSSSTRSSSKYHTVATHHNTRTDAPDTPFSSSSVASLFSSKNCLFPGTSSSQLGTDHPSPSRIKTAIMNGCASNQTTTAAAAAAVANGANALLGAALTGACVSTATATATAMATHSSANHAAGGVPPAVVNGDVPHAAEAAAAFMAGGAAWTNAAAATATATPQRAATGQRTEGLRDMWEDSSSPAPPGTAAAAAAAGGSAGAASASGAPSAKTKRAAERQLTKDDCDNVWKEGPSEHGGDDARLQPGTFERASIDVMKNRRIVRAQRNVVFAGGASTSTSSVAPPVGQAAKAATAAAGASGANVKSPKAMWNNCVAGASTASSTPPVVRAAAAAAAGAAYVEAWGSAATANNTSGKAAAPPKSSSEEPQQKLCASCQIEKGRDQCSKTQWGKRIGSGRCVDCVVVPFAGDGAKAGGNNVDKDQLASEKGLQQQQQPQLQADEKNKPNPFASVKLTATSPAPSATSAATAPATDELPDVVEEKDQVRKADNVAAVAAKDDASSKRPTLSIATDSVPQKKLNGIDDKTTMDSSENKKEEDATSTEDVEHTVDDGTLTTAGKTSLKDMPCRELQKACKLFGLNARGSHSAFMERLEEHFRLWPGDYALLDKSASQHPADE